MRHPLSALTLVLAAMAINGCESTGVQHDYQRPTYVSADPAPSTIELAVAPMDEGSAVTFGAALVPDGELHEGGAVWTPVEVHPVPTADFSQSEYAAAQASGDTATRLAYLDQAAASGVAKAHYDLAKVYTEGKQRPRDLDLAQQHLQTAASLGDPEATRVVGWQMIKGDGVPQNLNGGIAIMTMGVQQSVRAQRELGMLYANLYDDYKANDLDKGEMLLSDAYNAGDVQAAAALGKLYIREGRQIEAVAPLTFAASEKDGSAKKLLASLSGEGGASVEDAAPGAAPSAADGEAYYQQANAIMIRSHSDAEETKAYAMFSIASDMGYNMASAELAALHGVKAQRDKTLGAEWLDNEKQRLIGR